jgi:hypothetical protein
LILAIVAPMSANFGFQGAQGVFFDVFYLTTVVLLASSALLVMTVLIRDQDHQVGRRGGVGTVAAQTRDSLAASASPRSLGRQLVVPGA